MGDVKSVWGLISNDFILASCQPCFLSMRSGTKTRTERLVFAEKILALVNVGREKDRNIWSSPRRRRSFRSLSPMIICGQPTAMSPSSIDHMRVSVTVFRRAGSALHEQKEPHLQQSRETNRSNTRRQRCCTTYADRSFRHAPAASMRDSDRRTFHDVEQEESLDGTVMVRCFR